MKELRKIFFLVAPLLLISCEAGNHYLNYDSTFYKRSIKNLEQLKQINSTLFDSIIQNNFENIPHPFVYTDTLNNKDYRKFFKKLKIVRIHIKNGPYKPESVSPYAYTITYQKSGGFFTYHQDIVFNYDSTYQYKKPPDGMSSILL